MQDIFLFNQEGFDAKGRINGRHEPTGFVPKFYEMLKSVGIEASMEIFQG